VPHRTRLVGAVGTLIARLRPDPRSASRYIYAADVRGVRDSSHHVIFDGNSSG
jgi:hypothetical protein